MFLNLKGPNEVRIDDVWYNRDHNASITFSQSDERVRLVLKSNGHEVSKASFSKRDLPRLMDLFKNQRRFVFDSFSAAGSLKFDGSMSSNDFRLIFPGESESILMVADFSRALETMKGKPTDLYRMYPEIAKAVDAQTAISDKLFGHYHSVSTACQSARICSATAVTRSLTR